MPNDTPIYSISVPTHLLSDREVSATAKLLYGVIESFQRKSGVCYATNDRLAEEIAGCSGRTISRAVGELKTAGYITVDDGKVRKIRLNLSADDGQEGGQNCLPTTPKMARGVDKIGEEGGQNCPPSNTKSKTESKGKKKEAFSPLPVFVEWIAGKFGEAEPPARKNELYLKLVAYKEMRSDSSSPLNTKRKVDGLLADLADESGGDLDVMCQMLETAKRRCWLSVHAPDGLSPKAEKPVREERQYKCL